MAYSIWLSFDDESSAMLRSDIRKLHLSLGGPVFDPHLTLVGDMEAQIGQVEYMARRLAASVAPGRILVQGLETSSSFFMACYLRVQLPQTLKDHRRKIQRELRCREYSGGPDHVSLAYGPLRTIGSGGLLQELSNKYASRELSFRYVDIANSAKFIPVEKWRVIKRERLRSGYRGDKATGAG